MKRSLIIILCLAWMNVTWANFSLTPLMNKVSLHLQAEQWLTTKTALVTVGVNASVTDQGIEKIQATVMNKLSQLASAEWHLISFDRQQDKSGLETIQITAQARLAQADLGNLREKAKGISKPGETYTIDNIQFIPSDEEIRAAKGALRTILYQQAKAEIDTLNKQYPEQKFYLHKIDFLDDVTPGPVPMNTMMAKSSEAMVATGPAVGNKQVLQANVVLAAFSSSPIPLR